MVVWTAFWISEGPASFTFLEYLIVIFPYVVSLPTLYYLNDPQPKGTEETKEVQEDTHE
tara:strand:+ start:481 stop:657 length:177 start_codon:yes stop_codon:yes gene_type:complete